MKNRNTTIVELMMLSAGIAPVDVTDYRSDPLTVANKMLSSLSPEDRRVAVRKFRKQWKKAYKQCGIEYDTGKEPTRSEMRRRVWMVWQMFAEDQKVQLD